LAGLSAPDSVQIESRSTGGNVTTKGIARFDNNNIWDGQGNGTDTYKLYLGNGTTAAGWPSIDSWISFGNM